MSSVIKRIFVEEVAGVEGDPHTKVLPRQALENSG
jgi:hypothetical protein